MAAGSKVQRRVISLPAGGRRLFLFYQVVFRDEVIQVLSAEDDAAAKLDAGKSLPDELIQNAAADLQEGHNFLSGQIFVVHLEGIIPYPAMN